MSECLKSWAIPVGALFRLFLVVILHTDSTNSHRSCTYELPKQDEIITHVPLNGLLNEHHRAKRQASDDFQPLRIIPYLDSSVHSLPPAKLSFISDTLLPRAAGFWSDVLSVRAESNPIRLLRRCNTTRLYIDPNTGERSCDECAKVTMCGEVKVPEEHLMQCRQCTPSPLGGHRCGPTGPPSGAGVGEADFVLYVSAVNTHRCSMGEDTVAYAAHCQQEDVWDRPIAGHVNLCPSAISTSAHDHEVLLSTVKHELLHALGFSGGLYPFFRDKNGRPLTPRTRNGLPSGRDPGTGYFKWSDKIVTTVLRDKWLTRAGMLQRNVTVLRTPNVLREVRAHFNCSTLEGAELENQGGTGTRLTHWEKRLFENEAMTGTHTQNPVYSRLTFALMEDTGWYKVDYTLAEPLHWGRNLGCFFATRSCGDWMLQFAKYERRKLPPYPFCDTQKSPTASRLVATTCTDNRDAIALCNLVTYDQKLPPLYQNMVTFEGEQGSRMGGSVELADFCPYPQEFEWKSKSAMKSRGPIIKKGKIMLDASPEEDISYQLNDIENNATIPNISEAERRDSRCELDSNQPPNMHNAALETYSDSSKCFVHGNRWTQHKCNTKRHFTYYGSGCYTYDCSNGTLYIRVDNSSLRYPCFKAGQKITIRRIRDGWLHLGSILCPNCEMYCNIKARDFHKCNEEIEPPFEVGDPPVDVPCAGTLPKMSLFILCTALLQRFWLEFL